MKPLEITAFLMHLSPNNWRKKGCKYDFFIDEEDFVYHDSMVCDREVWRKVTDFLPSCGINTILIDVEDGVIYDRHPELAIEGSWTKDELSAELDRLRSIGLTPIPKCNFSCGHNAWLKDYAYMVGTQTFNSVCKDIVEELIELFDTPSMFHLGLEEEDAGLMAENYPVTVIRSHEKKAADAIELFDVCRAHGVRPWIWAEANNVQAFGGDEAFQKYVGKDVILSNWYYGILRYEPDSREKYPFADYCVKFGEWGYEQIPTGSTWSWHLNNKDIMRFCKNEVAPESIKGYMSASWMLPTQKKLYALLNDAYNFYNAKKDIYGE